MSSWGLFSGEGEGIDKMRLWDGGWHGQGQQTSHGGDSPVLSEEERFETGMVRRGQSVPKIGDILGRDDQVKGRGHVQYSEQKVVCSDC